MTTNALRATPDSWKDPRLPAEQLKVVEKELVMLREGSPPRVYTAVADALKAVPGSDPLSLLEVGCASGYYAEVIAALVGNRFKYTGADYSDAMIALARRRYPDTPFLRLDVRDIALPDAAYDVVLSGAVLQHVKEWKVGLCELARVARSYLILSRAPLTSGPSSRGECELYAGVPGYMNWFNKDEFLGLVAECGFRTLHEQQVYPHEGPGRRHMTFLFRAAWSGSKTEEAP